jgi:hypothetical protein
VQGGELSLFSDRRRRSRPVRAAASARRSERRPRAAVIVVALGRRSSHCYASLSGRMLPQRGRRSPLPFLHISVQPSVGVRCGIRHGAAGYVGAWVGRRPPWRCQHELHGGTPRAVVVGGGEGRGVFGAFADGVAACGGWLRRGRVAACLARSRTGSRRVVAGSSHSRLHGGTPRGDLLWAEVGWVQEAGTRRVSFKQTIRRVINDST